MWVFEAILIGLLIGATARLVVPGRHPRGLLVTAVVGIAGSVLATIAERAAGSASPGGLASFLASVAGAVVLLLSLQAIGGRSPSR